MFSSWQPFLVGYTEVAELGFMGTFLDTFVWARIKGFFTTKVWRQFPFLTFVFSAHFAVKFFFGSGYARLGFKDLGHRVVISLIYILS